YLKNKTDEKKARSLYLYGQEINIGTYAIAKINMFLHGLDSSDIQRGDTLADPKFLNPDGSLKTFDICVANPPYSISEWEYETFKNDKHGRVAGYEMPPAKKADYAFVLHMVKSMNENGKAGIVLPHGVLFRGGAEGRIREQLIKNDLIEAIIALPSKLFYGTGIPAAIVIFNKNKPTSHKNKILIIDGEKDFEEGKNQNRLRKKDIEKIVLAFESYRDIEKYARVVDVKELKENEFNLNVRRYVENGEEEEVVDVKTVWVELKEIEKSRETINKKVEEYLKELKY
ncbi:MAG: N-6 DNA methylase, partial [Patescibacteria group bacterium]